VLIPTYNNEASIAAVIDRAHQSGLPVLVVNDGSTDSTGEQARRAGAEVIDHPINQGKGQALLTGWQEALHRGFSHALTLDGDGQHLPEDLPVFLEQLERQPEALLVGNRPMDGPHVPRSSKVGRAISDFMLWAAAAKELRGERPDSQCGYRSYPLAPTLALPFRGRRYELEMEVLVRAAWHGLAVVSVPIRVHYPTHEERVSHFRKWRDNSRIVGIYTRLMLMRLFWPVFRPRKPLELPMAGGGEGSD